MSVGEVQMGAPACSLADIVVRKSSKLTNLNISSIPALEHIASLEKDPTALTNDIDTDSTIYSLWLVNFKRLLRGTFGQTAFVNDIQSRDLLHAVAGLYNTGLPNMDYETLYASITDSKAVTLIVFRQKKDALEDLLKRLKAKEMRKTARLKKVNAKKIVDKKETKDEKKKKSKKNGETELKKEDNEVDTHSESDMEDTDAKIDRLLDSGRYDLKEGVKDVYASEEPGESDFACIFTDSESEESDDDEDKEEDNDEETDFTEGFHEFIKSCLVRKRQQRECMDRLDIDSLGAENLVVSAATFETRYVDKSRILHLTLLVTRPRYRRQGLASRLMRILKDPEITGATWEAIVVHADSDAKSFFQRHDFSDDCVLNRRWEEVAGEYTECTLMTFMAAFSRSRIGPDVDMDLTAMERAMKEWRQREETAHSTQVALFYQMKEEVLHLRAALETQTDIVKYLMMQLRKSNEEKTRLEGDILTARYHRLKGALASVSSEEDSDEEKVAGLKQKALASNKRPSSKASTPLQQKAELNFDKLENIGCKFEKELNGDPRCEGTYRVTKVIPACVPEDKVQEFKRQNSKPIFKKTAPVDLYYCGSQEKPSRIREVLSRGFNDHDLKQSNWGRALHFSPHPATAALFSVTGQIIVAQVLLGQVSTIEADSPSRTAPPKGFQSILVPGRSRLRGSGDTAKKNSATLGLEKEYVIYNPDQILPIACVEYTFVQ